MFLNPVALTRTEPSKRNPECYRRLMSASIQKNRILRTVTLLEGWSKVVRIFYRQLRRDGTWQELDRDMLDRGNGITVLLYSPQKRTVLLLRQPRIIATLHSFDDGTTIEACNGLVESDDPLSDAYREVEEETGHRVKELKPLGVVYASPGSSLELVYLFLGVYDDSTRVSDGGGKPEEGEDIELLEVPLTMALQWIDEKIIRDARTIITLQHLLIESLRN